MKEQIAPFYVGQEVEAVENHTKGCFNKGQRFIVTSIKNGCSHYPWIIGIDFNFPFYETHCPFCFHRPDGVYFGSKLFRAITPEYEKMTYKQAIEIHEPSMS